MGGPLSNAAEIEAGQELPALGTAPTEPQLPGAFVRAPKMWEKGAAQSNQTAVRIIVLPLGCVSKDM